MKSNLSTWLIKGTFVTFFTSFGFMSFLYPPRARIIPLIICICGLITALADCIVPQRGNKEDVRDIGGEDVVEGAGFFQEFKAWGWLALFFGLVIFGGLIYGSIIFLFFFLKWFWKEKWSVALSLSLITGGCLYLLFHIAFQMELYGGLLFEGR